MGIFWGNGGVKTVKEIYAGVGGAVKTVKEVYVGQDGVPKLVWGKNLSGVNWPGLSLPISGLYHVIYGMDRFAAIGSSNNKPAAYSMDGITWATASISGTTNWNWSDIAYGNNKIIAIGGGTHIVYSTNNGISWTIGTILVNGGVSVLDKSWKSIAYGNNKFVAVAATAYNRAVCSSDCKNWSYSSLPSNVALTAITYGGGKFIALGGKTVAYSTYGTTWQTATLPISAYWSDIAYGNGKFVAVIYGSDTAIYSADGITWQTMALPFNANWKSIIYGDDKFVAVARNTNIAIYSTDGITWKTAVLPPSNNWSSVAYGNGMFVAVDGSATAAYIASNDLK